MVRCHGGRLHPDVYERNANTVEKPREELRGVGVDESELDDEVLRAMLERVSPEQQFVGKVSDVKAGQALARGAPEPLTKQRAKRQDAAHETARVNNSLRQHGARREAAGTT